MENLTSNTGNQTPIEVLLQVDDDGTVSARRVYEFLRLASGQFSRWAKTNILDNEFAVVHEDYTGFDIVVEGNPTTDYKLTIAFAKKLCMLQKNERGEQARDYFIKVEGMHKETRLTLNGLSPQLQLLINMELKQAELEKQLVLTAEKVNAVEGTLTIVKDTIIQRDDDWRKALNKMFNNAVESSGTKDFQTLRQETYNMLEERARCNLSDRLRRLHERLINQGATKKKIKETTKLDVIESDVRLKEIYTSIVKEFSIKYTAKKTETLVH